MTHPNATVVRTFLEAAIEGDMDTAGEMLADHVVWHFAGRSPISGEYRGKEGVAEFGASLRRILEENDAEHRVEIHDILANDDHTVVLWNRTARRGDDRLDSDGVGVYHVREGKIAEVWVVHADQYAADEFFTLLAEGR